MTELEKIEKELTEITDKYEAETKKRLASTNNTHSYLDKIEILLQLGRKHHDKIVGYTIDNIDHLSSDEKYYIEAAKRNCLSRFETFLKAVPL